MLELKLEILLNLICMKQLTSAINFFYFSVVCVFKYFNFFCVQADKRVMILLVFFFKLFVCDLFVDLFASHFVSFFLLYFLFRNFFLGLFCFIFSVLFSDLLRSLVLIFPCVNWCEREIWDMFGLMFINSFNLSRILTDYGFFGFPLRKDYPLVGFIEYFYVLESKGVESRDVFFFQEYRYFYKDTPWRKDPVYFLFKKVL